MKTILIADDDDGILKFLKTILEKDYRVVEAASGSELIDRAGRVQADLVIADIVMPHKSGFKSVKELKNSNRYSKVPVIFISGQIRDRDLYEEMKPAGESRFLIKPFQKEEILGTVRELIS